MKIFEREGKNPLDAHSPVMSQNSKCINYYFMLSGRISRNIGENIFRSYAGTTSENTDFHVLTVALR